MPAPSKSTGPHCRRRCPGRFCPNDNWPGAQLLRPSLHGRRPAMCRHLVDKPFGRHRLLQPDHAPAVCRNPGGIAWRLRPCLGDNGPFTRGNACPSRIKPPACVHILLQACQPPRRRNSLLPCSRRRTPHAPRFLPAPHQSHVHMHASGNCGLGVQPAVGTGRRRVRHTSCKPSYPCGACAARLVWHAPAPL